jgi:hypothetical protein
MLLFLTHIAEMGGECGALILSDDGAEPDQFIFYERLICGNELRSNCNR